MAEGALEPSLDVGAQSKLEDGDDDGSISLSLKSQSLRYDTHDTSVRRVTFARA